MITIKSVVRVASFEFENEGFKGNGEARVNADNTLQQINGTIYTEGGVYAGNFSSHSAENGELKYNLSGVSSDNLATAAEVVNSVVADLQRQIN